MRRRYPLAVVGFGALLLRLACAESTDNAATLLTKINVVDSSKPTGSWTPAQVGQSLAIHDRLRTGEDSRATAKLIDGSVLRIDELTTIEILPATSASTKATLDLKQGSTYFFSREKSREVNIKTPAANGAIRGTSFLLTVTPEHRTLVAMLSGEFELVDDKGSLLLRKGDQGEAQTGQERTKEAISAAVNSVQWYLLIETKLPPNKTIKNAPKEQFLDALCNAVIEWKFVAPQIAKAAIRKRKELGKDILRTVTRCLKNDCELIAQSVAAIILEDPQHASEFTDIALSTRPECAAAIEAQQDVPAEGENTASVAANINPPPGGSGSGAATSQCVVCHNGSEVMVSCDQVQSYLRNHPGDVEGPCGITPVTNP